MNILVVVLGHSRQTQICWFWTDLTNISIAVISLPKLYGWDGVDFVDVCHNLSHDGRSSDLLKLTVNLMDQLGVQILKNSCDDFISKFPEAIEEETEEEFWHGVLSCMESSKFAFVKFPVQFPICDHDLDQGSVDALQEKHPEVLEWLALNRGRKPITISEGTRMEKLFQRFPREMQQPKSNTPEIIMGNWNPQLLWDLASTVEMTLTAPKLTQKEVKNACTDRIHLEGATYKFGDFLLVLTSKFEKHFCDVTSASSKID